MVEVACRKCMRIVNSNEKLCEYCGSSDFTKEWYGMIIILDPKKSILSEKMNISIPSICALRVK